MNEFGMTVRTILLQNFTVLFFDEDRFVKILQGKSLGMVVAILRFGNVFAEEIVGEMAVHAGCHSVMARLLPGVQLRLHDMAIRTRMGIGAEVGETLGVPECESSDAYMHRGHRGQHQRQANEPRARGFRRLIRTVFGIRHAINTATARVALL